MGYFWVKDSMFPCVPTLRKSCVYLHMLFPKLWIAWEHLWPLTRKHTVMVFRWTAKAVGYLLGTCWRRWSKRWRHWKSRCVLSLLLKALKKAVGKFLPNRWKRWKKPLGLLSLPVQSAEKSRWENSSYLQRRSPMFSSVQFSSPMDQRLFGANQRRRKKLNRFWNITRLHRIVKKKK